MADKSAPVFDARAAAEQVLPPAARYAYAALTAYIAEHPGQVEKMAAAGGTFAVKVTGLGLDDQPRVALVVTVDGVERELAHTPLQAVAPGRPN